MNPSPVSYKRHRFPPQIIAQAVWLYFRFPLSLRLVEEMLLERGIVLSYETVRRWAMKFGADYARRLKRKKPGRRDVWHLDEVVVSINGEKRYLWRAVDQDGYVLDEIVQVRRNTKAAQRLLKRLLHKQGCALGAWSPTSSAPMPQRNGRSCRASSIDPQGFEQPRRKFPCAIAKTRASDAGVPIMARVAAFRRRVLRTPQPVRPTPTFPPLRHLHPSASPQGDRGMEIRDTTRLKSRPMASLRSVRVNVTSPKTRRHSDLMERLCVNSAHTELSFPPQHPQGNLPIVTTDGEIEA